METDPMKQTGKLHVLLSVSILSFVLFCYYSSCHMYNTYLLHSTILSPFATLLSNFQQFTNRKTMILFCNVIVLFLAKDSGLLGSPVSANNLYNESAGAKREDQPPPKTDVTETREELFDDAEEKAVVSESVEADLELVVRAAGGGGDEEGVLESTDSTTAEVDIYEVEQMGTTEDWNRKFEEFIEKVKRERRMEALRLVVV